MRVSFEAARRLSAMVVGTVQATLGGLAVIFAYFLHIDFFGVRESLNILEESAPFFMLVLIILGFFSMINGLYLLLGREGALRMEGSGG